MTGDLIPLSQFELDCPEPPDGWARRLEAEGVELVEDDIGRLALTRVDAARLLGAWRAEEAYQAERRARWQVEQDRRNAEWAAQHPVPRGIPVVPGMSGVEAMLLAGEGDLPPSVFTELLDDALAAGRGS